MPKSINIFYKYFQGINNLLECVERKTIERTSTTTKVKLKRENPSYEAHTEGDGNRRRKQTNRNKKIGIRENCMDFPE